MQDYFKGIPSPSAHHTHTLKHTFTHSHTHTQYYMSSLTRCLSPGCGSWAFERGLCRTHAKSHANDPVAQAQAQLYVQYKDAVAMKTGTICVSPSANASHLKLSDGEAVDILDLCSDNATVIVRTAAGLLGYYDVSCLMSEEEVYAAWERDNAAAIRAHEEERKEAERKAEAEYEIQLKLQMQQRLEEDRRREAEERERRKREAEAKMRALEEAREREQAELQRKATQRKQEADRRARERAALSEKLRAEARSTREASDRERTAMLERKRAEHQAWEAEQARKKDEEFLASLPKWKRELILRKRGGGVPASAAQ